MIQVVGNFLGEFSWDNLGKTFTSIANEFSTDQYQQAFNARTGVDGFTNLAISLSGSGATYFLGKSAAARFLIPLAVGSTCGLVKYIAGDHSNPAAHLQTIDRALADVRAGLSTGLTTLLLGNLHTKQIMTLFPSLRGFAVNGSVDTLVEALFSGISSHVHTGQFVIHADDAIWAGLTSGSIFAVGTKLGLRFKGLPPAKQVAAQLAIGGLAVDGLLNGLGRHLLNGARGKEPGLLTESLLLSMGPGVFGSTLHLGLNRILPYPPDGPSGLNDKTREKLVTAVTRGGVAAGLVAAGQLLGQVGCDPVTCLETGALLGGAYLLLADPLHTIFEKRGINPKASLIRTAQNLRLIPTPGGVDPKKPAIVHPRDIRKDVLDYADVRLQSSTEIARGLLQQAGQNIDTLRTLVLAQAAKDAHMIGKYIEDRHGYWNMLLDINPELQNLELVRHYLDKQEAWLVSRIAGLEEVQNNYGSYSIWSNFAGSVASIISSVTGGVPFISRGLALLSGACSVGAGYFAEQGSWYKADMLLPTYRDALDHLQAVKGLERTDSSLSLGESLEKRINIMAELDQSYIESTREKAAGTSEAGPAAEGGLEATSSRGAETSTRGAARVSAFFREHDDAEQVHIISEHVRFWRDWSAAIGCEDVQASYGQTLDQHTRTFMNRLNTIATLSITVSQVEGMNPIPLTVASAVTNALTGTMRLQTRMWETKEWRADRIHAANWMRGLVRGLGTLIAPRMQHPSYMRRAGQEYAALRSNPTEAQSSAGTTNGNQTPKPSA